MKKKKVNVDDLSAEELKAMLLEKEANEAKREAYEKDREDLITLSICEAVDLHAQLANFKNSIMNRMRDWLLRMQEHGSAKIDQESFELVTKDEQFKIKYTLSITNGFDERAKIAEAKMRTFLENFIKKKDLRQYNLFMSFLERSSITNEFDVRSINKFYKFENDFPEYPEYKEACMMFQESYVERKSKYYVRFFKRGTDNQWQPISLDLAAI
jgi:hypothetical protein